MRKIKKYKFELLLFIHFLGGLGAYILPWLLYVWFFILLIGFGLITTVATRNRYGHAHLAAAYIAGMEMLLRMSGAGFPHETGKYSVVLLLGAGLLFRNSRQPWSWGSVFFFVLLLPSIFMLD